MWRNLFLAVAITILVWATLVGILFLLGRRTLARELAGLLPTLIHLFRGLLRDPQVPRPIKAVMLLTLVWLASPIDLVPEFVPVVGPLDDLIIAAIALRFALRRTDRSVVERHWRGTPRMLERLIGTESSPTA